MTGAAASGKSSFLGGDHAALTYEVDLSNFDFADDIVRRILERGHIPVINYVYVTPEESVRRMAIRMERGGLGMSIDRTAQGHIELPMTLSKLKQKYGGSLHCNIFDNSRYGGPITWSGGVASGEEQTAWPIAPEANWPTAEEVRYAGELLGREFLERAERHIAEFVRDPGSFDRP